MDGHDQGSLVAPPWVHHNPSLPLAPLGELKDGDEFEIDASLDDQCGILVELEDTFSKEHSFDEPSDVDVSEVSPHIELINTNSTDSFPDLAPIPPISPLSSPFSLFLPSLDLPEFTFVESDTSVRGSPCLGPDS